MPDKEAKNNNSFFSAGWLLVSLVILLIAAFGFLIINIQTVRNLNLLRTHRFSIPRQARQFTAADVNMIDTWMTFRYINVAFSLPENYLSEKLKITDRRYPNLTLEKYIETDHLNKAAFLTELKNAVGSFLPDSTVK